MEHYPVVKDRRNILFLCSVYYFSRQFRYCIDLLFVLNIKKKNNENKIFHIIPPTSISSISKTDDCFLAGLLLLKKSQ